jgi:esterase/lipase superfamily enzyme
MTALLLSGTAAAQAPGTLLVGGFGQWTHYDKAWSLDTGLGNSLGFGFRFGGVIAPGWNLEGDGSYTPATAKTGTRFLNSASNAVGGAVKASALTFRIVHAFPTAKPYSIHVGAGGVLENFRDSSDAGQGTYQLGLNGLAGINVALSGLTLRADAFGNFLPSATGKFDFGVQAGLQFSPQIPAMFGRGAATKATMWGPIVWWDSLGSPLPGTLELGGFLQYTRFDDSAGRRGANPTNGIGYGTRAGVFLMDPRYEIEWDAYYAPRDNAVPFGGGFNPSAAPTEVNVHAFAMRLNYNDALDVPGGYPGQFIFGAGGVRTSYKFVGGTTKGNVNDTYAYNYGISGLVGARIGVANRTAVRLDALLDYMPNGPESGRLNLHIRGGISAFLGGARSEAMCTYAGLEGIPASSPNCVAPPPPPPPPPPPAVCQYNANILATDAACKPPVTEAQPPPDTAGTITVFYVTDRRWTGEGSGYYGAARDSVLNAGTAEFTVPPRRPRAVHWSTRKIGKFNFSDVQFGVDELKGMTLQSLVPSTERNLLEVQIPAWIKAHGNGEVLLFVHGFANSFLSSVVRTAQLSYDTDFEGVPIAFSWPSRNDVAAYAADEATTQFAAFDLKNFLAALGNVPGITKVHVLAHSMGNRVALDAIEKLSPRTHPNLLGNVITAAPDVDADVYRLQMVNAVIPKADRVTLYAAGRDKAMGASLKFHLGAAPRAGETGKSIVAVKGLDTIDVTDADYGAFGHDYFATSPEVLEDLSTLLSRGERACQRGLPMASTSGKVVWKLERSSVPKIAAPICPK